MYSESGREKGGDTKQRTQSTHERRKETKPLCWVIVEVKRGELGVVGNIGRRNAMPQPPALKKGIPGVYKFKYLVR
jgi:hypothetical protein